MYLLPHQNFYLPDETIYDIGTTFYATVEAPYLNEGQDTWKWLLLAILALVVLTRRDSS